MIGLDEPSAACAWYDEPEPSRYALARLLESRWSWLVVGVVTLLIFELTSNSALAVAVGCLKFGWHDFLEARRIRRIDPDRTRGAACARFRESWGLLKVSVVAMAVFVVVMMLTVLTEHLAGGARQAVKASLVRSAVTGAAIIFFGFFVSTMQSWVAIVATLRHRLRVWVGSGVNRLEFVLVSACLLLPFFCTIPLTLAASYLVHKVPQLAGGLAVVGIVSCIDIPIGAAAMTTFIILTRRAVARHPRECWPVPLDLYGPGPKRDPVPDGKTNQGFVIE